MFGRSLIEQVRADSSKDHRDVPMIVEKCILAVEQLGRCTLPPLQHTTYRIVSRDGL